MEEQAEFQFELPPPPQPPNEDQLRAHIHPLACRALTESMVPGPHPIFNTNKTVDPPTQAPTKIDASLSTRISRGREAGLRAVGCDEVGDLISAEDLYMEALSILIPASCDLDSGPESNRCARLCEKKKVQREASAILKRCENLRSEIEAHSVLGRSVPTELRNIRSGAASTQHGNTCRLYSSDTVGGDSGTRRPPAPNTLPTVPAVPTELKYTFYAHTVNIQNESARADAGSPYYVPDTAPSSASVSRYFRPSPLKSNTDFVTTSYRAAGMGMSSRRPLAPSLPPNIYRTNVIHPKTHNDKTWRNVSCTTSAPSRSGSVPSNRPAPKLSSVQQPCQRKQRTGPMGYGREVDVERCVVCGYAANFRAPCGHGFCTKCANQSVRGFRSCPVFTCNNMASIERFERMA